MLFINIIKILRLPQTGLNYPIDSLFIPTITRRAHVYHV